MVHQNNNKTHQTPIRYRITGRAAHQRIAPLLPPHWIDCSPGFGTQTRNNTDDNGHDTSSNDQPKTLLLDNVHVPHEITNVYNSNSLQVQAVDENVVDFLWENAQRFDTKSFRDNVSVYSHLPNDLLLDDKWFLARILQDQSVQSVSQSSSNYDEVANDSSSNDFSPLESYCFRGRMGFIDFANRVKLLEKSSLSTSYEDMKYLDLNDWNKQPNNLSDSLQSSPNLWVIKDANSNGAGGIWMVDSTNSKKISSSDTTPLINDHRYVAQKYVWPPILYRERKCHVRAYAVITSSGEAFVHRRAFLHVSNEKFSYTHSNVQCDDDNHSFDPEIHITNCCANSHDSSKFMGEICANFDLSLDEESSSNKLSSEEVPLAEFFPSVCATVAVLAKRSLPFIKGGERNNGFSYLGLDFILSTKQSNNDSSALVPVAHILEVNAPPSQDSSGLPHAEDLHNDVIRDLVNMWIIPKVMNNRGINTPKKQTFGWKRVFTNSNKKIQEKDFMVPSKASTLNKMKWALYEQKQSRSLSKKSSSSELKSTTVSKPVSSNHKGLSPANIVSFARTMFPYFDSDDVNVYLENAGGTQVPRQVINGMVQSLSFRHRCVVGAQVKEKAREVMLRLLGGSTDEHMIFFNANASKCFADLAMKYEQSGFLQEGDEIVLAVENHLANVDPWQKLADKCGVTIKWWSCTNCNDIYASLEALLTEKVRIVSISQSSNVVGIVRDMKKVSDAVQRRCNAHVVVDGVASAPHYFPAVSDISVDWYIISSHKNYGPHLGVLLGRKTAIVSLPVSPEDGILDNVYRSWETGTVNYEGCAGIVGLGTYFSQLARYGSSSVNQSSVLEGSRKSHHHSTLVEKEVREAYDRIQTAEQSSFRFLHEKISLCKHVKMVESSTKDVLIPILSFIHGKINSKRIVEYCAAKGVLIRCGTFLATDRLMHDLGFKDDFVRISLCHYNSLNEVKYILDVLESIDDWY